jgi:multidrug efflux pump subunit AcrB
MLNLFYRNRQLLLLTLLLVVVWGLSSFFTLPRLEDPEIVPRFANITTFLPGATPERVETLVTEPLEEALFEIEAIDTLESTSSTGVSVISIDLKETISNVDPIWSQVRSKVDDTLAQLPPEVSEPEFEESTTKASALIVGLTWELDSAPNYTILQRLTESLEDRLRAIPGTDKVELFGEPDEEIRVDIAAPELARLGLRPRPWPSRLPPAMPRCPPGSTAATGSEFCWRWTAPWTPWSGFAAIPIDVGNSGAGGAVGGYCHRHQGIQDPATDLAVVNGKPCDGPLRHGGVRPAGGSVGGPGPAGDGELCNQPLRWAGAAGGAGPEPVCAAAAEWGGR